MSGLLRIGGGSSKAYAASVMKPGSDAMPMLDPNHCIYEGCSKWTAPAVDLDDDYGHGMSFKENINYSDNKTKYYNNQLGVQSKKSKKNRI